MGMQAADLLPRAVTAPLVDETVGETFDEAFWPLFLLAFRAARRILRDDAAAEDAAAEVLARAHVRWDRLGAAHYREAWVVRCATNRAIDVVRRRPVPGSDAPVAAFEDQLAARLTVRHALTVLPQRQREAVALRYLVGLSEHDVAVVLGIGEGSVRRHLGRALQRLRIELKGGEL